MKYFLLIVCAILLAVVQPSQQGEYSPKGIYLGNRNDRQVQLTKLYADFSSKHIDIVTDPTPVLKETIGAYNNTLLVLLQTYSIVSTAAVTGNPKCDDPPKKESFKLVIKARDEGIQCLDAARAGILSDAGDAESIKELDLEIRAKWLIPLDECLEDLKFGGMKTMGRLVVDLIKCSVLSKA